MHHSIKVIGSLLVKYKQKKEHFVRAAHHLREVEPTNMASYPLASLMPTRPINITHLTSADPKQQKQILGETLFPIIYRKYPQQAGKITGMLLELEISELLFLLNSGEQLNAKVEEAYKVLQNHQVSVPAAGAYGQGLQQMSGARMGEMSDPKQPKDMPTKPINYTRLKSADPKRQKQILGETLFPIIYRKYPQQAGKITGMLLELEISELLFLLDSGEQLNAKMEEAYEVLQKYQVSVLAAGAYGQGLQQTTGARMGEMRGAVGRGRQIQNQQPRQSPGPRMKYTATAGAPRPNIHPMSMMMHQQQMMQGPPQQPDEVLQKYQDLSVPGSLQFCISTNDSLINNQGPVKTRSDTNSTSIQSSVDVRAAWKPPTRNTVVTIQHDVGTDKDTGISPKRESSQNFTFEQQTKDLHPSTPYGSFQVPNVEVRARNKFESETNFRGLTSPQKSECVENIQGLISRSEAKSKDPIFPTKLPSVGTCSSPKIASNTDQERNKRQNGVENKHQTQMHPEIVRIENGVCMSIKSVEDKIYDTARREHPNEANLIVGLITEKRNKEQLQLIATSDVLLNHEVEKAHSKIRMLETPMCQNYL